jgi:hypothetical protein
MLTRRSLGALALITFVLLIANIAIGQDRDVLVVLDDIVFFGFLVCVLLLLVLSATALTRAALRNRR